MPADDDPRRLAVRAWLAEHPAPTGRQVSEAGYVVPHWPAPWGLEADPMHQVVIDEEFTRAGVKRSDNAIGIGWAGPVLLAAGTEEQRNRYLPKILSGEEYWCQLFSEPDSGSDLAGLSTRAVRDGDEYVINGSKIWSSYAHKSQFGILLARTDPNAAKHKGISYFIMPMDSPGLTMQPIIDMSTAHSFNQVFFDEVRIPVANRVGADGDGWRLAVATLSNERASLSSGGSLWGIGPTARTLVDLVRDSGGVSDPIARDRLAQIYCESEVLRLMQLRMLSARLKGQTPGPEASAQKILSDEHGQHIMQFAKDSAGAHGLLEGSGPSGAVPILERDGLTEINFPSGPASQFPEVDPIWHYGFVFQPALTLGGGTFAIQRNIVGEQALGLPREPDVEAGKSWAQTRRG